MKVVFIEDLLDVAEIGDTMEVADGYARNYLLPKGFAVQAGSASSNIIRERMKVKARRMVEQETQMRELSTKITGTEITIKARAGAKDKLYGSVTGADIAAELNGLGYTIDKRKIEIPEPIRSLGSYDIEIKLGREITAAIKLSVVADAEAKTEEPEPEIIEPEASVEAEAAPAEEAVAETEAEALLAGEPETGPEPVAAEVEAVAVEVEAEAAEADAGEEVEPEIAEADTELDNAPEDRVEETGEDTEETAGN